MRKLLILSFVFTLVFSFSVMAEYKINIVGEVEPYFKVLDFEENVVIDSIIPGEKVEVLIPITIEHNADFELIVEPTGPLRTMSLPSHKLNTEIWMSDDGGAKMNIITFKNDEWEDGNNQTGKTLSYSSSGGLYTGNIVVSIDAESVDKRELKAGEYKTDINLTLFPN